MKNNNLSTKQDKIAAKICKKSPRNYQLLKTRRTMNHYRCLRSSGLNVHDQNFIRMQNS